MTVIGFTLDKISIERKNPIIGKYEINTKINVSKTGVEKIPLNEEKEVVKFDFNYDIEYSPNFATISFKGFVLFLPEKISAKDIVDGWKKAPEELAEIKLRIFNTIFHKCNMKAFELEEDFNLPPHLKLPSITADADKK